MLRRAERLVVARPEREVTIRADLAVPEPTVWRGE
jgi:hypothetical protein